MMPKFRDFALATIAGISVPLAIWYMANHLTFDKKEVYRDRRSISQASPINPLTHRELSVEPGCLEAEKGYVLGGCLTSLKDGCGYGLQDGRVD